MTIAADSVHRVAKLRSPYWPIKKSVFRKGQPTKHGYSAAYVLYIYSLTSLWSYLYNVSASNFVFRNEFYFRPDFFYRQCFVCHLPSAWKLMTSRISRAEMTNLLLKWVKFKNFHFKYNLVRRYFYDRLFTYYRINVFQPTWQFFYFYLKKVFSRGW